MSKVRTGGPPSNGTMAIFHGEADSFLYQQAISFPSGETLGKFEGLSLNCTGSPPSIGTFHNVGSFGKPDVYMTQPSEQLGEFSPSPVVNCLRLPPSASTLQM